MFTFGIFTTHIPYIAMLAFYAYFLVFGVEKTGNGKVQIAEKSITVEIHINDTGETAVYNLQCFYCAFTDNIPSIIFEKAKEKQRWKHSGSDTFFPQDYPENALFGRPPPAFA